MLESKLNPNLFLIHVCFIFNVCCRFDEKLNSSSRKSSLLNNNNSRSGSKLSLTSPLKTAQVRHFFFFKVTKSKLILIILQFGVTLKFINENSPCLNYIPPVVRMCVDHLSLSDGK